MTLSELQARVRDFLQADSDDLRYTEAKITTALNEGVQDMAVRAGSIVKESTLTTVAYSYQYALPTDCVDILRVYQADPKRKVWPLTLATLDQRHREWRESTGTTLEWYMRFSLGLLLVGPRPGTGGKAYTITYTRDPGRASMVVAADAPPIPLRYRDHLVDYACGRLILEGARSGGEVDQNGRSPIVDKALGFLAGYEAGLTRLRRAVFETQDRVLRFDSGWSGPMNYGVPG